MHRVIPIQLEQLVKPVRVTQVYFSIKQKSRRDLGQLFRDYADEDFEFDKTEVRVKLSKKQGEHVSRSEARRILFGKCMNMTVVNHPIFSRQRLVHGASLDIGIIPSMAAWTTDE